MNRIYVGDAVSGLERMKSDGVVVSMCVTSPPYYGLRDYGVSGQLGLEATPEEYISNLVGVFSRVWDVLADDGTLWVNIADSYASTGGARNREKHGKGSRLQGGTANEDNGAGCRVRPGGGVKEKDLIGIPWMLAFALRADGWYLRQDIIWEKPNPMPESVTDRCTKAHEYVFLLSKSPRYYYDADAIKEPAVTPASSSANDWGRSGAVSGLLVPGQGYAQHRPRNPAGGNKSTENGAGKFKTRGGTEYIPEAVAMRNKRSVWEVATKPYSGAHFAVFPEELVTPCILAGCPRDGVVLDPFMGSGTTAMVALQNGRGFAGCELNRGFVQLQRDRLGLFAFDTEWVDV